MHERLGHAPQARILMMKLLPRRQKEKVAEALDPGAK